MESALKNALDALIHDAKALNVPAPEVIEQAPLGLELERHKAGWQSLVLDQARSAEL